MGYWRQTRDNRFDDDVIYIIFQLIDIIAHFGNFLVDGLQCSFMANVNFLHRGMRTC